MSKMIREECDECSKEAVVTCDSCGGILCKDHTLHVTSKQESDFHNAYTKRDDLCGDCLCTLIDECNNDTTDELVDECITDICSILSDDITKKNKSKKTEAIKRILAVLKDKDAELQLWDPEG